MPRKKDPKSGKFAPLGENPMMARITMRLDSETKARMMAFPDWQARVRELLPVIVSQWENEAKHEAET